MEKHAQLFLALPKVMASLFADGWPMKLLISVATGIAGYLFPDEMSRSMAAGAVALLIMDTVTGFWASFVSKVPITSARFARVLTKLLGYGAVVLVAAVSAKAIPGTDAYQGLASSAALGFITWTEGISILENVKTMGVKVPEKLVKALRGKLKE